MFAGTIFISTYLLTKTIFSWCAKILKSIYYRDRVLCKTFNSIYFYIEWTIVKKVVKLYNVKNWDLWVHLPNNF